MSFDENITEYNAKKTSDYYRVFHWIEDVIVNAIKE